MNVTIDNAQVIFVNHSGGKDSQAMLAKLIAMGLKHKLVLVHADLGEMEHEPMHDWIEANSFGLPLHVVKSEVDFFELCRRRKRLPDGRARFCTDTLKTQPCQKFMKKYMAEHNLSRGISAIGIRAEESPARAQKNPWKNLDKGLTAPTKNRFFAEWYPIFDHTIEQVWKEIADAGQKPHRVYSEGFSRLSCVVCVFGKKSEHKLAAKTHPELFNKVVALEKELGKTIRVRKVAGEMVQVPLSDLLKEDEAA